MQPLVQPLFSDQKDMDELRFIYVDLLMNVRSLQLFSIELNVLFYFVMFNPERVNFASA